MTQATESKRNNRHIIVYDFETYWDSKSYTLSKMPVIDYVRHPDFYPQLMALSVDGKPPIVLEHDEIPNVLPLLGLQNPHNILIGHNSSGFDNLILSEYYGIHPTCILLDTIHMARWSGQTRVTGESLRSLTDALGLGEKGTGTITSDGKRTKEDFTPEEWESFKEYCKKDVALTVALSNKLFTFMSKESILFSDITAKMATNPQFIVDVPPLEAYLETLKKQEADAKQVLLDVLNLTEIDFLASIRSATKFAALLRLLNVEVPMKVSDKRTETARKKLEEEVNNLPAGPEREAKEQMLADPASYTVFVPALSKQDIPFLALQDHDDFRVRELVRLRLENNSSVPVTRTKALVHMGEYNKPVPILLKCFYAHTSRYGAGSIEGKSDSLNWQNFSKHKQNMKPIRKSIIVPPGHVVVACDSSQIEARVLAYAAQQLDLLQQFAEHKDPYAEMASKFKGGMPTADEIHAGAKSGNPDMKLLRNAGKKAVLSAGYGVGKKKFADSMWQDNIRFDDVKENHDRIAETYHAIYRNNVPMIQNFWATCKYVIGSMAMGESGQWGGPANALFEYGLMPLPNGESVSSVRLPTGFILRYPGLKQGNDGTYNVYTYERWIGKNKVDTRIYGGALTENVIQSLAFQILMYQAVLMREKGIALCCNIHDSFATVVPKEKADETAALMLECMRVVPEWVEGLPLDAEAEIGEDFSIV